MCGRGLARAHARTLPRTRIVRMIAVYDPKTPRGPPLDDAYRDSICPPCLEPTTPYLPLCPHCCGRAPFTSAAPNYLSTVVYPLQPRFHADIHEFSLSADIHEFSRRGRHNGKAFARTGLVPSLLEARVLDQRAETVNCGLGCVPTRGNRARAMWQRITTSRLVCSVLPSLSLVV